MKKIFLSADILSLVFLSLCIIFGAKELIFRTNGKIPAFVVIGGIFISYLLAVLINRIPHYLKGFTVFEYRRITFYLSLGIFLSQIIIAFLCDFTPKNDLSYICTGAKNLITGREIYSGFPNEHIDYFAVYPNNHMIFLIVYFLYYMEYFFTGNITDFLPTAVNILGLSISYWLMCRCAEMIYPPEKAFICAVRGMLFTPFITYASFFYTDSLSMPYVILSVYIYLKFCKNNKISYLILCGGIISIAFKMKGSSAIILIAIIIDMALKHEKIRHFIALIFTFIFSDKIISLVCRKVIHISNSELKEKSFPLIHWIMMSADGNGGYVREDFLYTKSFSGIENKINADITRLSEKINAQGFLGFLEHLADKISYTWGNCTFMAGYYYDSNFDSGVFYLISFLCHFTLLFSILTGMKNKYENNFLFRLIFIGSFLFFLIWETRCRYLVNLFPIFAIL